MEKTTEFDPLRELDRLFMAEHIDYRLCSGWALDFTFEWAIKDFKISGVNRTHTPDIPERVWLDGMLNYPVHTGRPLRPKDPRSIAVDDHSVQ